MRMREYSDGRRRAGQSLVEFVVVAAMMVLLLAMVSLFLYTFRSFGGRVLSLLGMEAFP